MSSHKRWNVHLNDTLTTQQKKHVSRFLFSSLKILTQVPSKNSVFFSFANMHIMFTMLMGTDVSYLFSDELRLNMFLGDDGLIKMNFCFPTSKKVAP